MIALVARIIKKINKYELYFSIKLPPFFKRMCTSWSGSSEARDVLSGMPQDRQVCFQGIAAKLSKETDIETHKMFSESDRIGENTTGNESTDHEREVEGLAGAVANLVVIGNEFEFHRPYSGEPRVDEFIENGEMRSG